MIGLLREWSDRLLGRGAAATTVPVMDGTLKPNRALERAAVVAELPGLDDAASDGRALWLAAGRALHRLDGSEPVVVQRFDGPVTALAVSPAGRVAVAIGGRRVQLLDGDVVLEALDGAPLVGANALAWEDERTLLLTEGSRVHPPEHWCHDLMTLGRSGRVGRWMPGGVASVLAQGLGHAFGVLPDKGGPLVAESWRHRVLRLGSGAPQPLVAELPGYPSRMAPASAGGFWLSCFVCRSQLVEFVLREHTYRRRMVAEIEPRYWIAPALAAGRSFLEPLQGAAVKQMGVLKPWAPPRAYGLVAQVADDGRIVRSLHSPVDGVHHGITAVAEHDGALFAVSKGSGRLLRVALDGGAA